MKIIVCTIEEMEMLISKNMAGRAAVKCVKSMVLRIYGSMVLKAIRTYVGG